MFCTVATMQLADEPNAPGRRAFALRPALILCYNNIMIINMKKYTIIYTFLFFVTLGFVFIYFIQNKKTPDEIKEESFLVLWAAANNNDNIYNTNNKYQLDKCDLNICEIIDSIISPNPIDSLIIYKKNNILFVKNSKIISRNFINKTEQVIFDFPQNYTLINGLTGAGDYVAWVSFDGVHKYSNVLNVQNNDYKLRKIDFLLPDEQVNIYLDESGQTDALILDVQSNTQESELWFMYYDTDKQAKHILVENSYPLFNVVKKDSNLFFYSGQKIYKFNLDDSKKEEIYSWSGDYCHMSQISNDAQWFVENIRNANGGADKYLFNFLTGSKYLVEKNVECQYYDSFWVGDKYYVENRGDEYYFLDIDSQKTQKFIWTKFNNTLVDVVIY